MSGGDWPEGWVRDRLGYQPGDPQLFATALTHRSASGANNERLEFLGDAVLNLVVARLLFDEYPQASEGDLSRLRARLVSSEPLAEVAAGLGVGEALQLGSGELKTGGFRRQSILADALEALCGALYLDGGLGSAERVIGMLFEARIAALPAPESLKDAKTRLQEYLQSRGLPLPRYSVERTEGEAHQQVFHVVCEVPDIGQRAAGSGSSRRRAEQEAAGRILQALGQT
ncbi:MAG TPA: ribonuclease III [Steroidobacteraceae bacterium]|nr:ribonuclease III [Steroidobacteraceae bacterium]